MSDHSHSAHPPKLEYQPALPIPNGKLCLWLFLSTEIMFFAGSNRRVHRPAVWRPRVAKHRTTFTLSN